MLPNVEQLLFVMKIISDRCPTPRHPEVDKLAAWLGVAIQTQQMLTGQKPNYDKVNAMVASVGP